MWLYYVLGELDYVLDPTSWAELDCDVAMY